MKDDARADAGAAVRDELALRELRLRLRPRRIQRPGNAARRVVDRVRLAAPTERRARIHDDERRIGQPPRELLRRDRVARPLARHELRRLDLLLARAQRPAPRVEPAEEHAAVVMAEMPEQPPEPLGAAEVPVGNDQHARPDARPRRGARRTRPPRAADACPHPARRDRTDRRRRRETTRPAYARRGRAPAPARAGRAPTGNRRTASAPCGERSGGLRSVTSVEYNA